MSPYCDLGSVESKNIYFLGGLPLFKASSLDGEVEDFNLTCLSADLLLNRRPNWITEDLVSN